VRRHIVMTSGGLTSWLAGRLVAQVNGDDRTTFLFTDTLIEDQGCYRLVIEGTADTLNRRHRVGKLLAELEGIPDVRASQDRRDFLRALASRAMDELPGLVWLMDGRTPWEVFKDEQYLGNTRADPCSKILKRKLAGRWRDTRFDPLTTTVHVGITQRERHRFYGRAGEKGLQARMAERGWTYEAPLIQAGLESQDAMELAKERGIAIPPLYALGFAHNNCGGFCVKAGHDHFRTLLEVEPDLYAYHQEQEEAMRARLGDVAILRDRAGGATRPLPLTEFKRRVELRQVTPAGDTRGCGCFIDEGDE
jgi:hypothetical protein